MAHSHTQYERESLGACGDLGTPAATVPGHVKDPAKVGFVHLHCHSNLSFKDSINDIADLAARARFQGQTALALTDHGHMFGAVRHALACKEVGIKPIFGMEAYEALSDDLESEPDPEYPAHLTLLVMNEVGWENICRLHHLAHTEDYAFKTRANKLMPRIDRKLLAAHSEGLICMSACLGGRVQRAFSNPDNRAFDKPIMREINYFREVFGDRFYVELMANTEDQVAILHRQRTLCEKQGVATVATNDVHYLTQAQGRYRGPHMTFTASRFGIEPLSLRIAAAEAAERNGDSTGESNKIGWYGSDEFYLKTADEMLEKFQPHEVERSVQIAEMCNYDPLGAFKDAALPPPPLPQDDFLFEAWRRSGDHVLTVTGG